MPAGLKDSKSDNVTADTRSETLAEIFEKQVFSKKKDIFIRFL